MKIASAVLLIAVAVALVVYLVRRARDKSGPAGGPEHGVPVDYGRGKA